LLAEEVAVPPVGVATFVEVREATIAPAARPLTVPVPPVLVTFCVAEPIIPLTWIPLMVITSDLFVALLVYETVMVVAVTVIDSLDKFALAATATFPVPARNSKLAGAVKTRVTFVPIAKSAFAPSVITIFPKGRYEVGYTEQVPIFRLGAVIVTAASALVKAKKNKLPKMASLLFILMNLKRFIERKEEKISRR
jgi:hypothetical protein